MNIVSIYPCPYDTQDRHDPSATVISGEEIYACEEDKLTSIKSDATVKFPERSMMMGLKHFNLLPSEIDIWVLPTPSQKPSIEAMKLFFSWHVKAFIGKSEEFASWFEGHVRFVDHHQSHISLAVHSSDFDECLFVSQDGGGDFGDPRNLIFGEYKNSKYTFLGESSSLNTICSFHAFVTDAIGFNGGDNGKTSGLAAYGKVVPELFEKFRSTLTVGEEGIFFNRERYEITLPNLQKVKPQEYSRSKIFYQYPSSTNIFHMSCDFLPQDIAATGECVLQTVFLEFLDKILDKTRMQKAVFSGGLFQNVSLNRRLIEHGKLNEVFIPMAPSDSGLS
ncbi:hypothetical protein OAM32_02135, partial [Alphaproteobacteria bacterium]|nr:hypothetical protein [Alphaproteobacteria bacterium]